MVKSLVDLCTTVCLKNYKDITDIGDIPYKLVRPIIMKVDTAAHLRQLEVNSPHLEEYTPECWQRLIAREFPTLSERNKFIPSNPRSWHKIYYKYQRMDADRKREAEEKLINAFKVIKKEKDDNVSQVINYDRRKLPNLPRDVRPQVGIRPRRGRDGPDMSELRFSGGSRTKTNTPKSLLNRARREAKEISSRNRLNTQAGAAQVRQGQIRRAPHGMVQERVTSARPLAGIRRPGITAASSELEGRERRLRQSKMPGSPQEGSYIADEDLDDFEAPDDRDDGFGGLNEEDLEALFDQDEGSQNTRASGGGASASKGSSFARRMNTSPPAASRSLKGHGESQPRRKAQEPPTPSSSAPVSQTSKSTSPTAPAAPSVPGLVPLRKRKAIDVFMKPKAKTTRT